MPDNSRKEPAGIAGNPQKAPELSEKLEILGRLAATIAHDVRNPLGTINTSIFVIRTAIERNQPERLEKALNLAERNIKRCDSILTQFLNNTQQVELRTKPVNIDTWIKGFVEGLLLPQNIELSTDLDCDRAFRIDPEMLGRALTNLITNALQALKDSDSEVLKIILKTGSEEGSLLICVSDTGAGIPNDVFPRIYEPLYSGRPFGIGLGLTVAKEIVEKHGGKISIQSKTGSGTKVTLKIPAI